MGKVMLRLDTVPAEVMLARRDQCRDCEFATRNPKRVNRSTKGLTSLSRCTKCDCFIAAKTQVGSEACPIGRWVTFPPGATAPPGTT
jgi:hypothetical protein